MTPDPTKLLAPLTRAIRTDRPFPNSWHEPLVELVEMLMADRDGLTAIRAVRVVVEMEAADQRRQRKANHADVASRSL